jgi:octaheme c-type cytochrome (tetrathionate reductase family)
LDSTLLNPTRNIDVHMGTDGGNFSCARCHRSNEHEVLGTSYPSGVADHKRCEQCHQAAPHNSATLNTHTARVACQTCHIPTFARGGRATMMTWDWSKAGRKTPEGKNIVTRDTHGNPTYDTQKGEFTWDANVTPDYVWFNGTMTYVSLDDTLDPTAITPINRLHGAVTDPKSLIFPVKRFTAVQPSDATSNTLAIPHLFGSDPEAYWKSYDWNRSIAAGMRYAGRTYSGNLGFVRTEMYWIQNHMVAPKEHALGCAQCHVPGGRMDFAALGYPATRAASLQTLAGFQIARIHTTAPDNRPTLEWAGTAGHTYQVQASTDLRTWSNQPDGERRVDAGTPALSWSPTGSTAPDGTARFFRILRTRQP